MPCILIFIRVHTCCERISSFQAHACSIELSGQPGAIGIARRTVDRAWLQPSDCLDYHNLVLMVYEAFNSETALIAIIDIETSP